MRTQQVRREEAPIITIPEVGMGMTFCVGSDRYAGTITRVSPSGKTFWFTQDEFRHTKNSGGHFSESQNYIYITNPEGEEKRATLRKNGRFRVSGYDTTGTVTLGIRRAYQDPSF